MTGKNGENQAAQPDMAERRRSPRVGVLLRVEYAAREDFAADVVTDLALGGVFIRTDLDFPIGTKLALLLSFPGLLAPTEIDCVVRWSRAPGPDVTPDQIGVGVEFLRMAEEARLRIRELLEQLANQRSKQPSTGPFRVLLAEDNTFVSELFRHALMKFERELPENRGHEVTVARTGHEALRMIEAEHADVVILDHYLPGITGCALLRKMRSMDTYRQTPILMVSVGGPEIRKEALDAGATLYLAKPVLLTQLLDTLRVLILHQEKSPS